MKSFVKSAVTWQGLLEGSLESSQLSARSYRILVPAFFQVVSGEENPKYCHRQLAREVTNWRSNLRYANASWQCVQMFSLSRKHRMMPNGKKKRANKRPHKVN